MSTRVRPISPDEYDDAAELTAGVYRTEGYSSAGYEPELRDVAGRAATATVLVAVAGPATGGDTSLLGVVTVATRGGPWAEQSVPGEAVIRMLAVAAAARGRGVGEALVRGCLATATADGCALVRLSSQEDMTAAHRLYERLGFSRTPAHDWSPVPGLDLRTYALALRPWCGYCGGGLSGEGHDRCRRMASLDPPRYCALCRRRLVVQVLPTGWTARCVEHGASRG